MKIILPLLVACPFFLAAQPPAKTSPVKTTIPREILQANVSPLFTQISNSGVMGFIGKEYQRLRIKFISVIRNNDSPDQYFVYGKSMVKENVCEFQGVITIRKVEYFPPDPEFKDTKQGALRGDYVFNENPLQKHAGQFKGTFQTNFYIDKDGKILYDDLMGSADGFSNNLFTGTWTSFTTKASRPCNWGDYRIPDSGDLDNGAGEFHPSEKYIANGWRTYCQAFDGIPGPESEAAKKIEHAEWWK